MTDEVAAGAGPARIDIAYEEIRDRIGDANSSLKSNHDGPCR
jgi:hypothetical protein